MSGYGSGDNPNANRNLNPQADYNNPNYNPNLLNPMTDTGLRGQQVPALPGITKPFPLTFLKEPEHYMCTLPNHHMHRTDGKRLAFVFGHLKTNDAFDVQYLNQEISNGNPFIRPATEQEINNYNMRVDPRGTMAKEMTPDIETRIRQELKLELEKEFERKLNSLGVGLTDEQKKRLEEDRIQREKEAGILSNDDQKKLQSMDAAERLNSQFTGGIKTQGATIIPSGASQLPGIQGSDKTTSGVVAQQEQQRESELVERQAQEQREKQKATNERMEKIRAARSQEQSQQQFPPPPQQGSEGSEFGTENL
jgi:hypothetical protein